MSSKSVSNTFFAILIWGALSLGAPDQGRGQGLAVSGGTSSFGSSTQEITANSAGFSSKETDESIVIDLSADVLFDFDRSDLRPDAEASLQKAAVLVASSGRQRVLIDGYTDAKGTVAHNQKLSLARAHSVRQWLARHQDLSAVVFATRGLGASNPVAPNTTADGRDDPEGRQKNRRVEITIRK